MLFPLFLIIAVLIKTTSKGPIFFFQERLGKNAKTFKVFKFRTMTHKKRAVNREILKGDPEVTRIGHYLRRFKIDELPQLLNVLTGDMSLVGPRPCMPIQLNDLNEDGKYRIRVKPGLTGLAQVNGNIYLTWEERWKYDRKYVENLSFQEDIKIILKTITIVLLGEEKFLKKTNV
jgi:lipopolysaccharide/colanic/teichoic acid biosynthesis glycosyltransferase